MLSDLMNVLKWCIAISGKFFKVVPRMTVLTVMCALVSQFSLFLAFLLPLKVIMLLGSGHVPNYFPSILRQIERDHLVASLSLAALIFYAMYFASEKLIYIVSGKAVKILLSRSKKIALFEGQQEVAERGYQRYTRSIASLLVFAIAIMGVYALFPSMLVAVFAYLLLSTLILLYLSGSGAKLLSTPLSYTGHLLGPLANVGFLISFFFLVVSFLEGTAPSPLACVVALILSRRAFSRVGAFVADINGLYQQRFRLNALFFHGSVLRTDTRAPVKTLWSLIENEGRNEWVQEVLNQAVGKRFDRVDLEWFHPGFPDTGACRVIASNADCSGTEHFLVKFFNPNRRSQAQHEAALLLASRSLPALELLLADTTQDIQYHVMRLPALTAVGRRHYGAARLDTLATLISIAPSSTIASQYSRSRPLLWQRLDRTLLDRLETVATLMGKNYPIRFQQFLEIWPTVMERLKGLPLHFYNPDIRPDTLLRTDDGHHIVTHWGRWTLEPVGCGWPLQSRNADALNSALTRARMLRPEFSNVSARDLTVASLVHTIERLCHQQQYQAALSVIARLVHEVNKP